MKPLDDNEGAKGAIAAFRVLRRMDSKGKKQKPRIPGCLPAHQPNPAFEGTRVKLGTASPRSVRAEPKDGFRRMSWVGCQHSADHIPVSALQLVTRRPFRAARAKSQESLRSSSPLNAHVGGMDTPSHEKFYNRGSGFYPRLLGLGRG